MPRALRTLVLLLLVALMPFRAVVALTVGFCATGHSDSVVAAHGDHGHGAGAHAHYGNDDSPAKAGAPSCSSCVEHCSGIVFAPTALQAHGVPAIAQDRIHFAERIAPAHVPDQLDRPPLA
jgi:hypothetical protein